MGKKIGQMVWALEAQESQPAAGGLRHYNGRIGSTAG
jgi:hypothetical protein